MLVSAVGVLLSGAVTCSSAWAAPTPPVVTNVRVPDTGLGKCPGVRFSYSFDPIGTDEWLRIYLGTVPAKKNRDELIRLVANWYNVASYGGFGYFVNYISGPRSRLGGREFEWYMDAGHADRSVFLALARALQGFSCLVGPRVQRLVVASAD